MDNVGLETRKIMIIDDEMAHVELIRRSLVKAYKGITVNFANTLSEGEVAIEKEQPDLLLLDLNLPDGKGIDFLLEKSKWVTEFPVIMMTSQGSEKIAVDALKAGAFDYLVKDDKIFSSMPQIVERTIFESEHAKQRREKAKSINDRYSDLEKTNKNLSSFVYSASHDLKAPLRSILGLINLTKQETSEYDRRMYLDMMEKSVAKLQDFIVDLVTYSQNSNLPLEISDINAEDLFNELIETHKFHEHSSKIDISTKFDGDKTFSSDIKRLNIVLNNLVSNAVKYHDLTKENPYINLHFDNTDSHTINIKISDNGLGIPEEYQSKIFDMFARANNTQEGSGLGLYIVKETVEKLGGSISFNSEETKGSEFILSLPRDIS